MSNESGNAMNELFEGDEVREVLRESFYGVSTSSGAAAARPSTAKAGKSLRSRRARRTPKIKAKPKHYDIICISMYKTDLARLDEEVARLKEQGHTKISRSGLIRFALDQMDTSKLPKAY